MRISDWSSDVCSSDLLAHEQSEAGIGEGVLHHSHDDEPWRNEIGEWHAHYRPPGAAQRNREDDQKEKGCKRRTPDRLKLDLEETPHLLQIERPKSCPIDHRDYRSDGLVTSPAIFMVVHGMTD